MIDFSWALEMLQNGLSPLFGSDAPVGIIVLAFVVGLCIYGRASMVLTAVAVFVMAFILTYIGFLPAVSYIFLVLIAGASVAYLIAIKANK